MNRPPGIPAHYVETSPGTFCHPSRVVRAVDARQPEPDQGRTLDRQLPAPKAGRAGVVRKPKRRAGGGGGGASTPETVLRVHLGVRRKPGRLFDAHDNLRASLKPLVDAIAITLGVEDKDPRVAWEYSQAETSGEEGVVVTLEIQNKSERRC